MAAMASAGGFAVPAPTAPPAPSRLEQAIAGTLGLGSSGDYRALQEGPQERVDELVSGGRSRVSAARLVARENMGIEVRSGLLSTLGSRSWPELCRLCCCTCCAAFLIGAFALFVHVACFLLFCLGLYYTVFTLPLCDQLSSLFVWLLLFQALRLTETCCPNTLRGSLSGDLCKATRRIVDCCCMPVVEACCVPVGISFSALLKIVWCLGARRLLPPRPWPLSGCDSWAPGLVDAYSQLLLVQLLLLRPGLHVGMRLAVWAATQGRLRTARGAEEEESEAISGALQDVPYEPLLFADPRDPADSRPLGECCVCLDEYSPGVPIVKTPCGHLLHRHCLAQWLRTSRCCPMCRGSLGPGCGA